MKTNFRKADYCPLDIIKPYQRKKLSHVGTVTWRTKTLQRKTDAPNHVGSGDFHEKAVKGEFRFTWFFMRNGCR